MSKLSMEELNVIVRNGMCPSVLPEAQYFLYLEIRYENSMWTEN